MRLSTALAVIALATAAAPQAPGNLTRTLTSRFRLNDMQRTVIDAGLDSADALPSAAADGVAAIGGIWIDAPAATYLTWADNFADVDRGSAVQAVRKLSTPPRLSDFDTMTLSKRATDVAGICASILDEEAASGLAPHELVAHFRGMPGDPLPRSTSYLYWTTNSFGLKPTTRLNHTVVYRAGSPGIAGIVATKMLYASHYFHGGLETRYVLADASTPDRFLLIDVTRTRSDGLTGMTGAILGDTIRRRGLQALRRYLRFTKDTVERRHRSSTSEGQELHP